MQLKNWLVSLHSGRPFKLYALLWENNACLIIDKGNAFAVGTGPVNP